MRVQRKMTPFRPLVAKAPVPFPDTSVQPNSRIVKQRRHHHTDTDWEDQKRTIFQLYIQEGKSAEDVVEILAEDFAFKTSRRQLFNKLKEWTVEKNKKRHREEEGDDSRFGSRGIPVPEDKIPRFAKRQNISALACSVPTLPRIGYFTPVGDYDITAPGQSTPQGRPGTPSLPLSTNPLYIHASPAMGHLGFPDIPLGMLDHALDMFDLRTPRLSPNRDVAPWLLPTPFKLQLDNLPWFIFQVLYSTFLKTQEIDSCERITDYDLSLDHPTNSSDVRRGVFIMEGLQLRPSMPEERRNLRYLLGLPGEHHRTDLGVFDESGFGPIIDVLSTSWTSDSPALNMEENIHTLHSYFRPFILEKHDGELLEGTARILGPPYDGLLQFLNYTINLLSNNLLSETDVDKIVRWIDEIQGYELFAKLLSTKSSTIEALASNLLPSALRLKNARFTRILLDARVDPNSPMGYHRIAPLQYITKHGDIELVRMLLDAGADVNAPPTGSDGQDGDTALQAAAKNGSVELIEILLDAGADINAPPPQEWGRTALQAAAMNGNIELVQILLDASADINAPPAEEWGYTVLQAAAKTGNIELVQILLDAGADINAPTSQERGRTALQAAAEKGNIELVEILLNAGADVNAPPSPIRGHTALQAAVAAEKGNIDLVEILLNAGADINDPPLSGYRKRTALQAAAGNGNIELVHVLLSAGTDINAPPSESSGRTALQAAAEKGNIELVQILLDAGADINAPTSQERGRTALQAAAEKGNIELVEILLNAGAEVNAPPSQEYGVTAIQAAVIRGHIRIAQLLLNAGADVNAAPAGNEGRTALEGAAEHGRIDLLQLLINAGADTNSSQCTRALKLAATNGYDAVCGLLNRFRNGDRISPPEVRQIKECEDQLSLWDEVHDSNYQPSEGSLPDEDTEDERDSLVEYGIGSSSDDVMKFSGEDGMAAEPFALYWCRYATD